MEQPPHNEQVMSRYLLRELSEEERARIEEQFFADDDFFEQLLAVEDELIDNYARGELPPQERKQFERYFLASPGQRRRVELARMLMEVASCAPVAEAPAPAQPTPKAASWWRSALGSLRASGPVPGWALAALLLFIALGAGLGGVVWRLRHQLDELRAQQTPGPIQDLQAQLAQERARQGQLTTELERERTKSARLEQDLAQLRAQETPGPKTVSPPEPPASSVFSLALIPVRMRGSGSESKVILRPGISLIELKLKLPAVNYQSYQASLQTAEGTEALSLPGLKAQTRDGGRWVIVKLPARELAVGDYQVKLSGLAPGGGLEPVGTYFFGVRDR
jgi:hypothetical protein